LFGPYDARFMRMTLTGRNRSVHLRVGSTVAQYEAWAAFLLRHPGSWSSLGRCPAPALYDGGSWRYKFVATGSSAPDRANGGASTAEVTLYGEGDPGYKFTAVALAEYALCLAGKTSGAGCGPGGRGGVFSPGLAVEPATMRARLEAIGLLQTAVTVQPAAADDDDASDARPTSADHPDAMLPDVVRAALRSGPEGRRAALLDALLRSTPTAAT